MWAIEIGFLFFEKIYPRQSLFCTRYERNLCKVIVTKILKGKNEESYNVLFSCIDVRCYHLTGDLNAWQSFVGNKAKSTCPCVSHNMICGKLQWWKLLWAILVICFLKSCVHYRLIVFKATVEWKLWLFIKYCLPCNVHNCRILHPFYRCTNSWFWFIHSVESLRHVFLGNQRLFGRSCVCHLKTCIVRFHDFQRHQYFPYNLLAFVSLLKSVFKDTFESLKKGFFSEIKQFLLNQLYVLIKFIQK